MLFNSLDLSRNPKTLLDVGCNAGKITAAFAEKGFFAVGVDINPRIIDYVDNKRPVIGYYDFNDATESAIPQFDVILLLSVHHQWVKEHGDEYAQKRIASLLNKANHYMFIEFATINEKYGYSDARFDDANEDSQKKYCQEWLKGCEVFYKQLSTANLEFTYLGKNKERIGVENFRHIFQICKK